MKEEHSKKCLCGKIMIKRHTGTYKLNPESGRNEFDVNWRCGCGHTEKAPPSIARTEEEQFQDAWEQAQIK